MKKSFTSIIEQLPALMPNQTVLFAHCVLNPTGIDQFYPPSGYSAGDTVRIAVCSVNPVTGPATNLCVQLDTSPGLTDVIDIWIDQDGSPSVLHLRFVNGSPITQFNNVDSAALGAGDQLNIRINCSIGATPSVAYVGFIKNIS